MVGPDVSVNEDSSYFHLQMFLLLIDKGDPSFLDRDGSRSDIGVFFSFLGARAMHIKNNLLARSQST